MAAFQRLGGADAPIRYYEDRRDDPSVRGLVLRDELLKLVRRTGSTARR